MKSLIYFLLLFFINYITAHILPKEIKFNHLKHQSKLNKNLLANLQSVFKVKGFIETGTFLGESTAIAQGLFDKVYTIELDAQLYNKAIKKFKDIFNVKVYHGDSALVLGKIIKNLDLNYNYIFWLDGHYSGPNHHGFNTAVGANGISPIIKELQSIFNSRIKSKAVILIDDLRLFDKNISKNAPHEISGYPNLDIILNLLGNKGYQVYALEDSLIAYPKHMVVDVDPFIEYFTMSRFLNYNSKYSFEEVLNSEEYIAQSQGIYLKSIKYLNKKYQSQIQLNAGLHYKFWLALTRINNEDYNTALDQLNSLERQGFDPYRIYWHKAQIFYKTRKFDEALRLTNLLLKKYNIEKIKKFKLKLLSKNKH